MAVELAEMLGAEIVGSDAYQVYRELPILTAAPSPEDRARVPHHMVSMIAARMPWDATEHYHRAMRCVEDIHARGKTAIVTGGSGLYFKFLSHGMSEAPPGDAALRAARMMQEGAVEEAAALGPCSATAERTLGLALIRSLLRGEITRETCQAKLALATRQYAKRQRTWLKREQWLRELPAAPSASPRELAKCIIRELEH